MREKKLQDKCIDFLKSQNIYYINVFGSGFTAKGAPDLMCCIDGLFVAFELKVQDNTLEPAQIIHKKRIERSDGLHFAPYTIDEFIAIINKIRKQRGV